MDGKRLSDLHLPVMAKLMEHALFKKLSRTVVMQLLEKYRLL